MATPPWRTNPHYRYEANRIDQSPCYDDYNLGQNAWTFNVRNDDGRTFDPATTTSSVTVTSVQLQAIDNPHVAYITTCRSYNLAPTWQADFQYLQGTVTATETMHLVDGAWKVSNRWQFTGTGTCT